jgi:diadenosine tetraphosphate (Ap4A) HIT family hydrolase
MEGCEFCEEKFSDTVIKEYDHWQVQLFLNQYYLGRCLVKLKRHAVDLTELREEERKELFDKILPNLKRATDELSDPDLYNYASLRNDCRHFHLNFIPRYESERSFNGEKFRDENWNSHYKPYPSDFKIKDSTFKEIKENLRKNLEK